MMNEKEEIGQNESIELNDLCTPAVEMMDVGRRLLILACYPTTEGQDQSHLLRANVASDRLTLIEFRRRTSNTYPSVINILEQYVKIPSFVRDKCELLFGELMKRLRVDLSILDYNYTRLNTFLKMLMYEQIRVFELQVEDVPSVNEKEYPCLLEFFLQFDVHLFYMKTCSFRFARPRTLQEGLFCLYEPEARYELSACGNCGLCCPKYSLKYRTKQTIVDFSQGHRHRFVNGYEVILNCSASCHTRNLIYALTCPCGKVDYIGATTQSLHDRLKKHREHGNRIMHEFLVGQENVLRDTPKMKTSEILRKDRMKLYQHSVRCPVAMQIFLDANPQYWRFVPMTAEESMSSEQCIIQRPVLSDELNWHYRSIEDTFVYIDAVPKPPAGYVFSNRQLVLQTQYFHQKRDQTLPNHDIDLYNASIIALLPDQCSDVFRYTIESLFITHAHTSLNTFGNVLLDHPHSDCYMMNDPWLIRGDEWCQGLLRRPQPK